MGTVIHLFKQKTPKATKPNPSKEMEESSGQNAFSQNIQRNKDASERLKQARIEANKTVLKDYNIKE